VENQASWPEDQARTTVVSLPGEISYYTAPQVHDELLAALEPGVTTVILDLTLTTFFDSAGLAKITVARELAAAYHIDLRVVVPPSSPLAGFFGSSGLDREVAIYPTLRGALTAPRTSRPGTFRPGTSGAGASGAGASGAGTRSALPLSVPGAWVAGGVTWSRSN
jgi:anti-sigma B factor antagonist